MLKSLQPKIEKFQVKTLIFFNISAEHIDCRYSLEPPRQGGSNENPQSMCLAEIRKIMYTPVNPSVTIQKWGLRGSTLYRLFCDGQCGCAGRRVFVRRMYQKVRILTYLYKHTLSRHNISFMFNTENK